MNMAASTGRRQQKYNPSQGTGYRCECQPRHSGCRSGASERRPHDPKLVSAQEHEIEYLARKHGTSVEKVKEISQQTGSRSREQIEAALDKQAQHVQRRPAKRVPR